MSTLSLTIRPLRPRLPGGPYRRETLHPNLAVLYRERVDRLQESLADPPVLELQGQIAGLVQLAAGGEAGKQIASLMAGEVSGDFKSSVKVVAGTGNRLNFLSTAR